ncbi:hypothetical protein M9H77_03689 [Catharanthus roseus]|uniref:Uncharacterized protein n=1 Tax=Catharanthus roseus TaxID=4058 RepID=A0ACC0CBZ1_CATRO|nr:hypothetical protein M9H77_03689 [Catharanthus roseus]
MVGSITLDLDSVDRGRSPVGGLGLRRGYFLKGWVRRRPPARVAQGGLVEKSNVRIVYFRVQVDIDYGMPEFVLMTTFKVSDPQIGAKGMENEERHHRFLAKPISFFTYSFSVCFEIFFKEIKLFPFAFISDEDALVCFNSLWNMFGKKHFNFLSSLYHDPFDYAARFMDPLLFMRHL